MKESKSQLCVLRDFFSPFSSCRERRIDTPVVIQRVSHLFFGHPQLIIGFNTFLPAGYRIECTSDGPTHSRITVINSDGTIILYQQPPIPPPGGSPEKQSAGRLSQVRRKSS
ncbi:uncharacterized protein BT62DRAFT_97285 [Guyanagaster necrorhizus]|uniref:Uncharacterized protein n=1 Tax=Guyanagaster necrorhizus TaxID=856835 RepID=A0A9P7VW77_9AGAR|nr:uncharacterized protein BT62DRAFT_97285 [Guyanagaster necrorhizus MCA 3950]KAG7447011.1 hypothetical protein BT62DRAFT_97285 [Guyanagaster necrorhizus MCA 3950]